MKKKLSILIAAGAVAAITTVGSVSPASALHCRDSGRPGNSDFSTHVRASNGKGGHNEGDHRGWSSCQETSANYVETP